MTTAATVLSEDRVNKIFVQQLEHHVAALIPVDPNRPAIDLYETAFRWFLGQSDDVDYLRALSLALAGIDAENTIRLATAMSLPLRSVNHHVALFTTDAPGILGEVAFNAVYNPLSPGSSSSSLERLGAINWNSYLFERVTSHTELSCGARELARVLSTDWGGTLEGLLETAVALEEQRARATPCTSPAVLASDDCHIPSLEHD